VESVAERGKIRVGAKPSSMICRDQKLPTVIDIK
jgi:hypothetical protein